MQRYYAGWDMFNTVLTENDAKPPLDLEVKDWNAQPTLLEIFGNNDHPDLVRLYVDEHGQPVIEAITANEEVPRLILTAVDAELVQGLNNQLVAKDTVLAEVQKDKADLLDASKLALAGDSTELSKLVDKLDVTPVNPIDPIIEL